MWNLDFGVGEPFFCWGSILPFGPWGAGMLPDRPAAGEPAGMLIFASVPSKLAARFKSNFDDMLASCTLTRIPASSPSE